MKATFMSNSKTFTAYTKEKLMGFLKNNLLLSWSPKVDWTSRIKIVILWPCMMDGAWAVSACASDVTRFRKAAVKQQRGNLPFGFVMAAERKLRRESWVLQGK